MHIYLTHGHRHNSVVKAGMGEAGAKWRGVSGEKKGTSILLSIKKINLKKMKSYVERNQKMKQKYKKIYSNYYLANNPNSQKYICTM